MPLRGDLLLLFVFIEFILFKGTSLKHFVVCSDNAVYLLKQIWLFVCTLAILLFICNQRFSYMTVCKCSVGYRADSVFSVLTKDEDGESGPAD